MTPTLPAIAVSKSTLMHASLAHFSPEVQTMDGILSSSSSSPPQAVLPAELLFLIRNHLFMTITAHLVKHSAVALEVYERSLINLLCSDCVAYNLDIYGPDIWQWDHFSGACACVPLGNRDPRMAAYKGKIRHMHGQRSRPVSNCTTLINPKQFVDREHWLESHLSSLIVSSRVVDGPRHTHSMSSEARDPAPSSMDVWDVVNSALRDFDCEVVREPEDVMCSLHGTWTGRIKRIYVRAIAQYRPEPPSSDLNLNQGDLESRTQIVLHKASRDLCLLTNYSDIFSTRTLCISSSVHRFQWPTVPDSYPGGRGILNISYALFYSLTGACLSFPLGLARALLTLMCFYSKPRSLKIF